MRFEISRSPTTVRTSSCVLVLVAGSNSSKYLVICALVIVVLVVVLFIFINVEHMHIQKRPPSAPQRCQLPRPGQSPSRHRSSHFAEAWTWCLQVLNKYQDALMVELSLHSLVDGDQRVFPQVRACGADDAETGCAGRDEGARCAEAGNR